VCTGQRKPQDLQNAKRRRGGKRRKGKARAIRIGKKRTKLRHVQTDYQTTHTQVTIFEHSLSATLQRMHPYVQPENVRENAGSLASPLELYSLPSIKADPGYKH